MSKRRKKKFTGNDRLLMFLCRDVRRRWQQYGENRPYSLKSKPTKCVSCSRRAVEWDHIIPVGKRVYSFDDLPDYIKRMVFGECQPMCQKCNRKKRDTIKTESVFGSTLWKCYKCKEFHVSTKCVKEITDEKS